VSRRKAAGLCYVKGGTACPTLYLRVSPWGETWVTLKDGPSRMHRAAAEEFAADHNGLPLPAKDLPHGTRTRHFARNVEVVDAAQEDGP
jgi:hypothetical protein